MDVIDEKTRAALSQIGREEKAAAADKASPIVRHRASVAQQKVMGFTSFNPSYDSGSGDLGLYLNINL